MKRVTENTHYGQGYTLGDMSKSKVVVRKNHLEKQPAQEVVRATLQRTHIEPAEARRIMAEAREKGLLWK